MSAPGPGADRSATTAIAIVLARGGSKGLPRKNALSIAGRPCIEWTIGHAVESMMVGEIIVSTDDAELRAIAGAWGPRSGGRVRVHQRPAELAGDTATVDSAARDALVRSGLDAPPQRPVVILYGNVPVRPAGLIDRAVGRLLASGADSVQSYAPVGKYHPWWMVRVDPVKGLVRPWEGEVLNHGVFRRQDLPPAHVPDGGVLVVTRAALMLEIPGVAAGPHAFFGRQDRRAGVLTQEGEVVDIDSRTDMLVAEALLSGIGGSSC